MKKFLIFAALCVCTYPAQAITLEEMTTPQDPAFRLGVGSEPEKVFKVSESDKKTTKETSLDKKAEAVKNITYADLSLKKIAKEISEDGTLEADDILNDIKLLWIGAAQNSQTIKFIVYKLSNPDEEKPKEGIVKKIIQPLSTVGSLAGMGMGANPIGALSAIMGSSVLGTMAVDDKDLNYKFSKVNDADMVVLIRKIEELQRKICNYYFDYMTSRESLIRSDKLVQKRRLTFLNSQEMTNDQIIMIDASYRAALNTQSKLRSDYLAKRSALEQVVGMETMAQFEETVEAREQSDASKK